MIVGTKSRTGDFFKINFSRLRFLYPNEFFRDQGKFFNFIFRPTSFYNFSELFSGSGNHLQKSSPRSGKF